MRIEQKGYVRVYYIATRRGEEEETEGTTSFFCLPPHLPGRSYVNPDWQLRWTVHIRRLSTMPLVQQWTVNVHGWQGGFVDTEKWERKEREHTLSLTLSRYWSVRERVRERESTYLHRHFLDPWQMCYLLIQRSERIRVLDCTERINKLGTISDGYSTCLCREVGVWGSWYTVRTTNPWRGPLAYVNISLCVHRRTRG